jgi:hypothetical protein
MNSCPAGAITACPYAHPGKTHPSSTMGHCMDLSPTEG